MQRIHEFPRGNSFIVTTNLSMDDAHGINVIRLFMQEHQLTQADLLETASQGIVSEVLSGKRELNIRMIRRLSDRFQVNPKVFICK